MADDDKEDLSIHMHPQVQEAAANDSELAKVLKNLTEALHTAHQGVKEGKYASLEDGIEALTGSRPVCVMDGEVVEGHSMMDELNLAKDSKAINVIDVGKVKKPN